MALCCPNFQWSFCTRPPNSRDLERLKLPISFCASCPDADEPILQRYLFSKSIRDSIQLIFTSSAFDRDLQWIIELLPFFLPFLPYLVDTFQEFLIAEHIKPRMHILEISILSLKCVVVRPTKTPKSADKKMAQF